MKKIASGIEGFDTISKGGFPKDRLTLVSGTPGSGKTIFCVQFLLGGILNSNEPGVYVTFEETPKEIITNMFEMGWDISKHIEGNMWKFVDVSFQYEESYEYSGDYDLSGLIIRIRTAVKKIGAKRVALDSIAILFNRFPDKSIIRKEILRLKAFLNTLSVTTIITNEVYDDYEKKSKHDIIDFVSDNVVILKNTLTEGYRRRTIEILKYRGADHLKGQHSFTIKGKKGIIIISFEQNPLLKINKTRRSSGIKNLDPLIGGGFYMGSNILISGDIGTGKTILALSIIEGKIKQKEKCLMFNFEESRDQIQFKALNWETSLEVLEKEDNFKMVCVYPESSSIEEHIIEIKEMVFNFAPNLLVIDNISALGRITSRSTFRKSLINLLLYLREGNITSIFTSTISKRPSSFIGEHHISKLSDTIILLRYYERDSQIKRILSIMKMRGSEHKNQFFEYSIDKEGIHILNPIEEDNKIFLK